MSKRALATRLRSQHGAAAVEFALILPVLMMLLLGIVEYGSVYNAQITLTSAAREAAREASLRMSGGDAEAEVLAAAGSAAAAAAVGLDADLLTIDIPAAADSCSSATSIEVTVSYQYTSITGLVPVPGTLVGKAARQCGT